MTEFMDFLLEFRQQLNRLEPSEIVPLISYQDRILIQFRQLLPDQDQPSGQNAANPRLYLWVHAAWEAHGHQTISRKLKLNQMVLDSIYGDKWPNTIFPTQFPDNSALYLQNLH
ncbi:hypothetical protein NPIL_419691 [Nephila pilipes]|uniref:Uncharacterized protein n=1 Tax=Nephila pilipes TaxID=299642 RepID=A0A8X6QB68_NEPPI|nr:hypothetical protein NPIL_419691 [Nephila pilipes]